MSASEQLDKHSGQLQVGSLGLGRLSTLRVIFSDIVPPDTYSLDGFDFIGCAGDCRSTHAWQTAVKGLRTVGRELRVGLVNWIP